MGVYWRCLISDSCISLTTARSPLFARLVFHCFFAKVRSMR